MLDKQKLRAELKQKRKIFNEMPILTKQINDYLLNMLNEKKYDSILFYFPIHSEVNILSSIKYFMKKKTCLLPKSDGRNIKPVVITNLEKLLPGQFGVLEPMGETYSDSIDVAVVPGLGFSANKHRLGYGKGYYDQYLRNYQGMTIGCFYHGLLCSFIPEKHDVPLKSIITEKGIF